MTTYIYTLECPIKHTIIYVGKTINIKERYHTYCKPNSRGGKKITNYLIYLRNKKLKPIFNVIDQTDDEEWSWLEKFWISQLKTWGFNLLNVTDGGEKQYHYSHTEETKKIIGDKRRGRKLSTEWRDNISQGRLGINFSEEHINNLSKSHIGIENIHFRKSVYKLNHNFEILDEYESITDALNSLNVSHDVGSISKVCKGKLKSALGYHWCYVDDYDKLDISKFIKIPSNKIVVKFNKENGNIITKYNSLKEAAIDNYCHYSSISRVCNKKQRSLKGFGYVFENDYNSEMIQPAQNIS